MSNRAESIAAQSAEETEAKRRRSEHDRSKGINAAERRLVKEQIKIGRIVRFREAAAAAIEQWEAARAAGLPVSETDTWTPPAQVWDDPRNPERLTIADAREELAEAERRAVASGRGRGRWTPRNPERMTPAQLEGVVSHAANATAAAIDRKVNRAARLSEDEREDLRSHLRGIALGRTFEPPTRGRPADVLRFLKRAERMPLTVAREQGDAGCPRWRAILGDDEAAGLARTVSGTELATLRGRWIGFLTLHGRAWRRERAERMAAEREAVADAERSGEAATAAVAAAETAETAATVETLAERLEAAGRPLGTAERVALLTALSGLSRREIAERLGHDANYVKVASNRGRTALLKRWPTARAARRDCAQAAETATTAELLASGWDRDPMGELAERVADAWRAMLTRDDEAAALAPSLPRRGRRILPIRPRVAGMAPVSRAEAAALRYARQNADADASAEYRRRGFPRSYREALRPVPATHRI